MFVSDFDWLENKINKYLIMLQEKNSVLERQPNIVLRSIMTKGTQLKTKEKRKIYSNNDSFEDSGINNNEKKKMW